MKVTVSEPTSYQRIIDIEIPQADFLGVFNEKLKTHQRKIKLPGFRPGKVPAEMVRTRFGDVIKMEVVEDLIQKAYKEACENNKIVPIVEAKIDNLKAPDEGPLSFSIQTEVDPPVEIKGYEKLKVKVSPKKIKPADVDETIEELRERLAEYKEVDRPSRKGDLATIEYASVVVDGEPRSDFKNPTYPVEIGASKLKEFDKELVGCTAGDTVEVKVKFPKDYAAADVAGKTGQFQVKVLKIQEKLLPEVNEDLARKMGNYETVDALRESIKAELEKRELDRAKNEAYNKAIETLIKNNPFEVPPSRVERYIDMMFEEVKRYAAQGGAVPQREEVAQRYHETGINTIKRYRIIDSIAEQEKIKATQQEVDEQIRRIAEQYNQPFEAVKEELRKNGTTNRIRLDIREQKTLDFLIGEIEA